MTDWTSDDAPEDDQISYKRIPAGQKDKFRLDFRMEQGAKLEALLEKRPDLFEEFNLKNDIPWADLTESDLELLSEHGEVDWFSFDDLEADRIRFYKFRWSDVEDFDIIRIPYAYHRPPQNQTD